MRQPGIVSSARRNPRRFCSHRNACQLYEVAEHEGRPFLVLEFLEGEALSARLKRGRMDREEALGVFFQVMDALIEFHAAGLIHRDIKPSNVFLTPHGAKLLDFGLARRTERDDAMTAPALTAPGAIAGTLRYMAPEQLTGDPIDARTDVFALGVMFFEMLTGRVPFGHGSNVDWLKAVLTEDPESLDDPDLRDLDPVVARALARRPDDRYSTVAEMSRHCTRRPTQGRRRRRRLSRHSSRNRKALSAPSCFRSRC